MRELTGFSYALAILIVPHHGHAGLPGTGFTHFAADYKAELEALRDAGVKPIDHGHTHKQSIGKVRCCAASSSFKPKPRPDHEC